MEGKGAYILGKQRNNSTDFSDIVSFCTITTAPALGVGVCVRVNGEVNNPLVSLQDQEIKILWMKKHHVCYASESSGRELSKKTEKEKRSLRT